MEIEIQYNTLFGTFLCFIFFFLFFFMIHKLSSSMKPFKTLPPGPWKLPLIGNLHQIGSLPHQSFRDLANKYGPIMHLQLGQVSHIIVSSPEVAKEVMKTHDTIFANRSKNTGAEALFYNCTDILFSPYGNYWRQLRKICTLELFSSKKVQTFRKIREEEVFGLVKDISSEEQNESGSIVNLTQKLYQLGNSIIARAAFGQKTRNVNEALLAVMDAVEILSGLSISDLFPSLEFLSTISGTKAKIEKTHRELDRVLANILNDRLVNKSDDVGEDQEVEEDLVDVLLRIQKENNDLQFPFTLDNIKAILLDMFLAGTETSATTIDWAMAEMMKNPQVMKKAQQEVRRVYGQEGHVDESKLDQLNYVVIRETLRLHPPGPLLVPRENSEICQINGYEIPLKTRVTINAWAIGRHPDYWNEPNKFEPERFINNPVDYKGTHFEFIPFGAGRRICPGMSFATPILESVIANLLYHFDWKLPNGEKHEQLDMTERFGISVRRKNDLCLVPISYCPKLCYLSR